MISLFCTLAMLGGDSPVIIGGLHVHPARLLVKPAASASESAIARSMKAAHAAVTRKMPDIGWEVIQVPQGELLRSYRLLSGDKRFAAVQFDKLSRLAYSPNDPLYPDQWHMRRIKADLAWDVARGNPAVKIAIMDTGVQYDHPDLAPSMWTNPGEIPANGIDDDHNGYIDDVHGYDFAYNDPDPDDQYGHGTACAGLAAAMQDNNIGVTGVAPYCKIVAVKASLDSGYFYDSANVPALLYCANMGFKVVSMSFYSDGVTPAERDAIDYCWSHGVLPVAAAGNDSQVFPYYPGAYENTLAVAATEGDDSKAWFSNWGTWVDVASPGTGLTTTAAGSGYTGGFGGTSGATPQVAGLAGLLFGANSNATNAQVRAAIEDTAMPTVQQPYGQYTNYGFINCQTALARVLGQTSGSVTPRFLFASPIGGGVVAGTVGTTTEGGPPPTARFSNAITIYGVGFELPNVVRVFRGPTLLPLLSQTRNWVTVPIQSNFPQTYTIMVNGLTVGTFDFAGGAGLVYSPSDVSTKGGGNPIAMGGFKELYKNDNFYFTCTKRDDNLILAQMPIRKVTFASPSRMDISFTRLYQDNVGGNEIIYLYDWSTASYPYGQFVEVSNVSITDTASHTVRATITSNPGRFIDPEGTMYVQIVSGAPGANARLMADSFRVTLK